MPDIDIDFSVKGRDRVIQYVADKYGRESVAQIVTFGRMFPRAATRDAARVLGYDYGAGDRIAKLIPEPIMGRSKSFDEYLAEEPDLRRVYDSEPEARQIIDVAQGPRGDRAQLVDPRGRGRDRRPPAHRHRAAQLAEDCGGRRARLSPSRSTR